MMIDTSELNEFGLRLLEAWQKHRPREVLRMPDPTTFFRERGEEVVAEVERRRIELEDESTGPDFLANVRMFETARFTAESEVMREYLPTPETIAEDEESS